jgi:hypothetical protein
MADKKLTEEQKQALQTLGGVGAFGLAAPAGAFLPFQNLLEDTAKIKQQEAQRMFPGAGPGLFDTSRGGVLANKTLVPIIPLSQSIATSRVFDKNIKNENLYQTEKFYPEYLTSKPGVPSSELGSYQQAVANKTIFPEGDIQALTVTPGPNSARFAQDYAEILGDKLGKTINQFESSEGWNAETARLGRKIDTLSAKIPGQTAGYIWGNTGAPQYTYAEGNWGQGQRLAGTNPSIYVSRINADPSKEAEYLYTGSIKIDNPADTEKDYLTVDPRARFKQYEELGPGTGPSWGLRSSGDMHFRKDLIGARGELTTGDLQALLAERGLPFVYQSKKETPTKERFSSNKKPGDILQENLEALAKAENITTSQAIERFARLVPNVGEPSTPPTEAIAGKVSRFPAQGQGISPSGSFASKTDLRQLGILPPSDKASYSPFKVDEFDKLFKYVYPRYNASNIQELDTYSTPVDPLDPFGESQEGVSKLIINRDKLRPQAANKLLDKRVANLVEQSKPIQGLGLGGLAAGAIGTAMDPAVIDALARGDYQQAGTTAAVNTAVGSAVGGGTAKALQGLRAAGYARPAAIVGGGLPVAAGALAGLGIIETSEALNRAYKGQTGKDWITRNQPASPNSTYTGPTPTIQPRMGTAILNGKPVQVPYGSVAGTRTVGRPWWDKAGSGFQNLLNRFNAGSIIGR